MGLAVRPAPQCAGKRAHSQCALSPTGDHGMTLETAKSRAKAPDECGSPKPRGTECCEFIRPSGCLETALPSALVFLELHMFGEGAPPHDFFAERLQTYGSVRARFAALHNFTIGTSARKQALPDLAWAQRPNHKVEGEPHERTIRFRFPLQLQ